MAVAPDQIRLEVPARRQSLFVLRNMAAYAARLCGFSYNRVEESRLAVSEAASLFVADGKPSTVQCSLTTDDGALFVEIGATPGPTVWPPELWADSLEHTVLSSLANDLTLISEGGPLVRMTLGARPQG